MKKKITMVVGAAIIHNGRVFIAKRNSKGQNFGKWEFPGGKIEEHESDKDALIREIREELEWEIDVGTRLSKKEANVNGRDIILTIYLAHLVSGNVEPKLHVHSAFRWVEPENLLEYDFPEADQPAVEKLLSLETPLVN